MTYLISKRQGFVHRDIAARNVLLDATDGAKLADLGLSRVLDSGADEQSTKSNVGPVRWMAPEMIRRVAPLLGVRPTVEPVKEPVITLTSSN